MWCQIISLSCCKERILNKYCKKRERDFPCGSTWTINHNLAIKRIKGTPHNVHIDNLCARVSVRVCLSAWFFSIITLYTCTFYCIIISEKTVILAHELIMAGFGLLL